MELNKTDWDKISEVPDYTLSDKSEDESEKKKTEDESDNRKSEDEDSPVVVKFLTPLDKWIHERHQVTQDQGADKGQQKQEVPQVTVQVEDG